MIKICECGKEFTTYPSRIKDGRGKYCGRSCSDKYTLIKPGQHISPGTEIKPNTKPHNFKGESFTISRKNGKKYRLIFAPSHPYATAKGYVREHRLVMEKQLGRYLTPDEVVDHINPDETLNNSPTNLRVMKKVDHDRMNVKLNIHRRWYA